jgi:hypothetical protein
VSGIAGQFGKQLTKLVGGTRQVRGVAESLCKWVLLRAHLVSWARRLCAAIARPSARAASTSCGAGPRCFASHVINTTVLSLVRTV